MGTLSSRFRIAAEACRRIGWLRFSLEVLGLGFAACANGPASSRVSSVSSRIALEPKSPSPSPPSRRRRFERRRFEDKAEIGVVEAVSVEAQGSRSLRRPCGHPPSTFFFAEAATFLILRGLVGSDLHESPQNIASEGLTCKIFKTKGLALAFSFPPVEVVASSTLARRCCR